MIKIEVRVRHSVGELSIEHEYRAELPDTATADQIKAVGAEANSEIESLSQAVETKNEAPANLQSINEPAPTIGGWKKQS